MPDMLHVVCGQCGLTFEAPEDSPGGEEICPYCGEIVDDEPEELVEFQPAVAPPGPIVDHHPEPKGIPAPLWWSTVIVVVVAFLVAIVSMLRGDDWERQHLQELAQTDQRAAAFMFGGDFNQAKIQYQSIVAELNGREIQSIYLRQLLDRARLGEAEAARRAAIVATQPAATAPAQNPAIAQGIPHEAIINFQRAAESFPLFVRAHPILFQDAHGDWRRRQIVVWDVEAELQPQSDPQRMSLKYTCNSRTTAAHTTQADANLDIDFPFDEHVQPIHCTTQYLFHDGVWTPAERDSDLLAQENAAIRDGAIQPENILDLSDLRNLETRHFAVGSATR